MPKVTMNAIEAFDIQEHTLAGHYNIAEMRAMDHQNDLMG
jgi:hypothetical protein